MFKKTFLLVSLLSLPLLAPAETCPSIDSIHSGNLQGWVAINNDTSSYADLELIKNFESDAIEFTGAEWTFQYFPFNKPGLCYYYSPCMENVYLAKDVPQPIGGNWHPINNGKKCDSTSVTDCSFNK